MSTWTLSTEICHGYIVVRVGGVAFYCGAPLCVLAVFVSFNSIPKARHSITAIYNFTAVWRQVFIGVWITAGIRGYCSIFAVVCAFTLGSAHYKVWGVIVRIPRYYDFPGNIVLQCGGFYACSQLKHEWDFRKVRVKGISENWLHCSYLSQLQETWWHKCWLRRERNMSTQNHT